MFNVDIYRYSCLPALLYYAQHCYTEQEEVEIELLKRNFEGICGAGFDDWIMASKVKKDKNVTAQNNTTYPPGKH